MKKLKPIPKSVIEVRIAAQARARVLKAVGNRNLFSEMAAAKALELDALAHLAK